MEHRQICHGVEFQIMRVDTLPPKRWSVTPVSPGAGCTEWFPAKVHGLEGQSSNFKVEMPGKHHLSPVIKANINRDGSGR